MSVLRRFTLPWTTVGTNESVGEFLPVTEWVAVGATTKARGWLELRGEIANLSIASAIQTANVVSSPDSHTVVQTYVTAEGVSDPTSWQSISADGKKYIRAGYSVKSGTQGTVALGRVAGVVELAD